MVFDGRPIIGASGCAASTCAFFAVSFSARAATSFSTGAKIVARMPRSARVDRDGGLEDQTFVAGRQNSSIECTWPLGNTKAPKNSALTKAVTVGWITPNRPC